MFRRNFLKNIGIAGAVTAIPAQNLLAANAQSANEGVSGKVHNKGNAIAGCIVSDGYTVTNTDQGGKYKIPPHPKAEFVFISIPAGYHIDHEQGIARFYQSITKAATSYDFDLEKNSIKDDKHTLFIWADPQIRDDKSKQHLIEVTAPDTAEHIKLYSHTPVHGICVGDFVQDKFDLLDGYTKAISKTSIPYFQLIGNHDMNYEARTDDNSANKFKSLFGPTYYSFNRGKIHYIMLDDVFFIGKDQSYIGYLTEDTLQWMEKDLQFVKPGSTLIVSLHIPTNTADKDRYKLKKENIAGVLSNREHLYSLLKSYKVHFMSGHTHWNENWEKDNMIEHNHGTICGAWWRPQNMNSDGAPNGYAVYEIDGSNIKWYYKSVGFPKEYQFKLYPAGRSATKPDAIVANVWNYDQQWDVEWFEDGITKGKMEQFTGFDPDVEKFYPKGYVQALTSHLFAAIPTKNAKQITVKVTDRFGNIYQDQINIV
jgi:hypothetical protein